MSNIREEVSIEEWQSNQLWERQSWGNEVFLTSSNNEAKKQLIYAREMGLISNINEVPINLHGKSVLDMGCGPISLLLRSSNFAHAYGVEPLYYGSEVVNNYNKANIKLVQKPIEHVELEDFNGVVFDEVWMYNVLEHVISPKKCLEKLLALPAKRLRIFEWINIPPSPGHPFMLTVDLFVNALSLKDGEFKLQDLNESGCVGGCILIDKKL